MMDQTMDYPPEEEELAPGILFSNIQYPARVSSERDFEKRIIVARSPSEPKSTPDENKNYDLEYMIQTANPNNPKLWIKVPLTPLDFFSYPKFTISEFENKFKTLV